VHALRRERNARAHLDRSRRRMISMIAYTLR
jgi:hypothetical protein